MAFVWLEEYEESFQKLKDLLTTACILTLLEEGVSFMVYGDTSSVGFGSILI